MLLNFFRISETGNQRRYASAAESSSAHDDPRGTLLCHGTHVPITQKPPQALPLSMHYHASLIDNGFGSRQLLLFSFQAALESPFSDPFHTAIPPPAALCDIRRRLTPLSHRFLLFLCLYSMPL